MVRVISLSSVECNVAEYFADDYRAVDGLYFDQPAGKQRKKRKLKQQRQQEQQTAASTPIQIGKETLH